jgi:acetyltransferase-like isoleucine patch superfamily enzyme
LRKYSYIGYGSAISDCSIGSFCSIAANVKIGLGIHPTDHISTSPLFYSDKNVFKEKWVEHNEMYIEQRKVIIENDVWIGTDAKIMGGVTIGNGAIVGAGAVVTHNVAPYAIVGGVPAKLIRHRFSESEIVAIEKSEWWNWPDERLFFGATSFRSYSSFANYLNELHAEGERT